MPTPDHLQNPDTPEIIITQDDDKIADILARQSYRNEDNPHVGYSQTISDGGVRGKEHLIRNIFYDDKPVGFATATLSTGEGNLFALLADNFVKLGFYGKLLDFKSEVGSLGDQIARGKASLAADLEELLAARKKGWDMPLSIMPSVPLRAREIGEEVSRLTELSTGFLNGLKNVMYYVTGVVITVVGSLALFDLADEIVGVEQYWYYIAMAVACVAEVIFMRFIWSRTHCQVTGVTMLTTLAGPVLFALVIAAAAIALIALGVALAIGAIIAVLGSMSGG